MSRAAVFVALTGALAALLAVIAAFLAARRGVEINIWLTISTALVVGLFVAFLWLGPRDKRLPDPEGFAVVARRRTRVVKVVKTEPVPAKEEDPSGRSEAGVQASRPRGEAGGHASTHRGAEPRDTSGDGQR